MGSTLTWPRDQSAGERRPGVAVRLYPGSSVEKGAVPDASPTGTFAQDSSTQVSALHTFLNRILTLSLFFLNEGDPKISRLAHFMRQRIKLTRHQIYLYLLYTRKAMKVKVFCIIFKSHSTSPTSLKQAGVHQLLSM